jgi:hypothetical protein
MHGGWLGHAGRTHGGWLGRAGHTRGGWLRNSPGLRNSFSFSNLFCKLQINFNSNQI